MTLQIALLGSNGVLLASDTRKLNAYPDWPSQDTEEEEKVILSKDKSVAAAWSGTMPSREFLLGVVESFRKQWGEESSSLSESCSTLWEAEKRERQSEDVDCTLLVANSQKRQIYKAFFLRGKIRIILHKESHMRFGVSNGNDGNPACFFIYGYLSKNLVTVDNLVRLAAHYVLMGAKVNPLGVGGLTIHLSKDGNPFEEIPEHGIIQLMSESNHLDRRISEFLLTPLSADRAFDL